jgi:cytochrome c553
MTPSKLEAYLGKSFADTLHSPLHAQISCSFLKSTSLLFSSESPCLLHAELTSTTDAFRTMAILDWLLHLRRRAKLAASARLYCHVPMADVLFRRMSGFERVVTMSYRELAYYLSCGGDEAARASGASIPRMWNQPPAAIAHSVNKLQLHTDRMRVMHRLGQHVTNPNHKQPGSGQQLLVMTEPQRKAAGYGAVVNQAFDFFLEYGEPVVYVRIVAERERRTLLACWLFNF